MGRAVCNTDTRDSGSLMKITETRLKGAFVIEIEPVSDERGFFSRVFCQREFENHGMSTHFVQGNISFNKTKGTLRGMHFQAPPFEEEKLVRCTKGAIYDVIIDLRSESPTYLQWLGLEMSETNHRMLYIPKGLAHGFQTLCDNTEVSYQHTEFYAPQAGKGVRWDDPAFGIEWPDVDNRVISAADQRWPLYAEPLTLKAGHQLDR